MLSPGDPLRLTSLPLSSIPLSTYNCGTRPSAACKRPWHDVALSSIRNYDPEQFAAYLAGYGLRRRADHDLGAHAGLAGHPEAGPWLWTRHA